MIIVVAICPKNVVVPLITAITSTLIRPMEYLEIEDQIKKKVKIE